MMYFDFDGLKICDSGLGNIWHFQLCYGDNDIIDISVYLILNWWRNL